MKRLIYIDIDGTICKTKGDDYANSLPLKGRIKKINQAFKNDTIVFFSARGVVTGKNWLPLTKRQFKKWGVRYDNILLAKPPWDLIIDDKAINDKDFFN
jgi:hypothetical protein